MRYLRISSPGVADVESFTVLGASSSRGDEKAIGQFGSGAKHAILCALRLRLQVIVYCGAVKIVPQTSPQVINGTMQERVSFRIGNKTEASSMVLDFGSLDWKEPARMLLREFVSNALDSVGGEWSKISLDYVDKPRASKRSTQVYIELTDDIRELIGSIHHQFLHVSGDEDKQLLPRNPGPVRFFRKGVFVHSVPETNALYTYNCGDELAIDESRNLNEESVRSHAARLLTTDQKATKRVLRTVLAGTTDEYYESGFSNWYLRTETVVQAFHELHGDDACVTDNPVTLSRAMTKGLNCVLIMQDGWRKALLNGGVKDAIELMSRADAEGFNSWPASAILMRNIETVWGLMSECGMCGAKSLDDITVREFESPMTGGRQLHGYYSAESREICILRASIGNWKVLIEELAHYATGAGDECRDFQDFAFGLSSRLMRQLVDERNTLLVSD